MPQKPQDLKALAWSWINIFLNFFARSWDLFVSWLWWHFCKSSGEWIKVLAHFQPTSADTLISAKAKDFCKLITSPLNSGWIVRRCLLWYWRLLEDLFFAKFLASMGLFINDVIIFGECPRFSLQSTLCTLNTWMVWRKTRRKWCKLWK